MNYTKGEWKVREVPENVPESEGHNFLNFTDEYQITNENGFECIAIMGTAWASGKAEANAHLITAAPNYHEACCEYLNGNITLKEFEQRIIAARRKVDGST